MAGGSALPEHCQTLEASISKGAARFSLKALLHMRQLIGNVHSVRVSLFRIATYADASVGISGTSKAKFSIVEASDSWRPAVKSFAAFQLKD